MRSKRHPPPATLFRVAGSMLTVLFGGCLTDNAVSRLKSAVDAPSPGLVVVVGEVQRPGFYELRKPVTLTEVISAAGNFTDTAYIKKTEVRRSRSVFKINMWDVRDGTRSDFRVVPGDVVIVPAMAPLRRSWGPIGPPIKGGGQETRSSAVPLNGE